MLKNLPVECLRPAQLTEVLAPGILFPTAKYGMPFLVVGEKEKECAIFLDGDWRFQFFPRAKGDNWSGVAIEGVSFQLNLESSFDAGTYSKQPGTMIRRDRSLSLVALPEGHFPRGIEIPIRSELPEASAGQQVGFSEWLAYVLVDGHRRVVWNSSVAKPAD